MTPFSVLLVNRAIGAAILAGAFALLFHLTSSISTAVSVVLAGGAR